MCMICFFIFSLFVLDPLQNALLFIFRLLSLICRLLSICLVGLFSKSTFQMHNTCDDAASYVIFIFIFAMNNFLSYKRIIDHPI
ncbi:hypothetical protein EDM02_04005 [Candidatus Cardinium hertigii]|uniref:Uncharacterized protein n=1 Tax=Candidatus Cardinium hertigii TaxID=247481 RepID=A0A3N2QBU4_9BACT|nr:hypothetical protein EDM02_04005 [Candidatus Cardinium hertigii]